MVKLKMILIFVSSLFVSMPSQALSLNGITEFSNVLHLNAATRGVIQSIEVKPGQRITKGDVLIRLDDTAHQASLQRNNAIASSLEPDVTIAQLEFERAEELYALDSLSQVDLQNAENKLVRAQGDYQAAQAEAQIAAYDLKQTVLIAPFDGRVLEVHVSAAQYVDPAVENVRLVTLADSRRMIAVAEIGANQWSASLINKPATVKVQNRQLNGKVSFLSFKPETGASGGQIYRLHVSFATGTPIPAGLPVAVEIQD